MNHIINLDWIHAINCKQVMPKISKLQENQSHSCNEWNLDSIRTKKKRYQQDTNAHLNMSKLILYSRYTFKLKRWTDSLNRLNYKCEFI